MRFQSAIVRAIRLFPPIEKKLIVIAELLGYQQWVAELPGVPKGCSSRERVWDEVRNLLSRGERVHVLEFGVAWGYMTKSWFDSRDEIIEKWDGYDRFTGLPRSWRDLDAGAFDAGGIPPALTDDRLTWHVGDVEETLSSSIENFSLSGQQRVLYVFDLDLLEPSLHCWNVVRPFLKGGDLLYFDEAFDRDERELIERHVLTSGIELQAVAYSTTCLLLRVS